MHSLSAHPYADEISGYNQVQFEMIASSLPRVEKWSSDGEHDNYDYNDSKNLSKGGKYIGLTLPLHRPPRPE